MSDVLSDNFLNADRLPFRERKPPMVCPSCTWSFRDRRLRQMPTETTGDGVRFLSPPDLLTSLSIPVGGDRAVCVPILGRKHLFPWLRWATVMSDHGDRPWGQGECDLLASVAWLRGLGFGEQALREHSPRWVVLGKVDDPVAVLSAWDELRQWRTDQTIEVAVRATRKPKEAVGADDAGAD